LFQQRLGFQIGSGYSIGAAFCSEVVFLIIRETIPAIVDAIEAKRYLYRF
jgi:hypothetical protein